MGDAYSKISLTNDLQQLNLKWFGQKLVFLLIKARATLALAQMSQMWF